MEGTPTNDSPSSVEPPAESGDVANADMMVTDPNSSVLLSDLQNRDIEPIIGEPDWHNQGSPDFQERVLVAQFAQVQIDDNQLSDRQSESEKSSMAMALSTCDTNCTSSMSATNTASCNTPSLDSNSTFESASAAHTSQASSVVAAHVLEEDVDGILIRQSESQEVRSLRCIFWFLSCRQEFHELREWDVHCRSHFNGHLPRTVNCPFPCGTTHNAATGEEAWQELMLHIIGAHRGVGMVDTTTRPDPAFLKHLWNNGIIDNGQLKELRLHGRITGDAVFKKSAGLYESRGSRRPHTAQRAS